MHNPSGCSRQPFRHVHMWKYGKGDDIKKTVLHVLLGDSVERA